MRRVFSRTRGEHRPDDGGLPDAQRRVEELVLAVVGRSDDFARVRVVNLGHPRRWRVQTFLRRDPRRIDGDWHIELAEDGSLAAATPALERRYFDDVLEGILPLGKGA